LNPIENFFLRNRLERIQAQTAATSSIGIGSHEGYKFLKLLGNHHGRDTKQDPANDDDLLLHDDDDSTKKQEQQVVISNLVLIFPGAGGPDSFTLELENNIKESLLQQEQNDFSRNDGDDDPTCIDTTTVTTTTTCRRFSIVETLDWTRFRGSIFSASYDGEAFGEAIGQLILQQCQSCSSSNYGNGPQQQPQQVQLQQQYPQNIHLIGISVGAFAANACCSTLRCSLHHDDNDHNQVLHTSSPYTRLTLLDPFTSRGIGGLGYGNANFGIDADYAEQYLNTDDPVPSTNEPLDLCATWDVTGAVEREEEFVLPENETMHCWPLVYFARYVCKKNAGRVLIHGQDGVPERGSVTFL
jgi:hypothetical protein